MTPETPVEADQNSTSQDRQHNEPGSTSETSVAIDQQVVSRNMQQQPLPRGFRRLLSLTRSDPDTPTQRPLRAAAGRS